MPKGMLGNNEALRRIMSGPLCDLAIKLNGQDGDEWEAALAKFLRKEPVWANGQIVPSTFAVWRTVKHPATASAAYYRDSYKKKGIQIGSYADQILDKVDWSEGPDEVDIARVFVRDLGFKRATRRDAIYDKALASGLQKLPTWVAAQLRDEYDEQPDGEWLVAGMEPLTDSDGSPRLFRVGRDDDGERWLDGNRGGAGLKWSPDRGFLWAVPRK